MQRILYFSYGSNLDEAQMWKRCPEAWPEATATLTGYALAFGGYSQRWGGAVANVVKAPGARVEGLLYSLTPTALARLDGFEGHPFAYLRVTRLVTDASGRRRRAQVYLQPAMRSAPWAPPPEYVRLIARAYKRLGFSHRALRAAVGGASWH